MLLSGLSETHMILLFPGETSWQIDEETVETVADFIFWAPESLQLATAVMKSKDVYSLEEKLWPP